MRKLLFLLVFIPIVGCAGVEVDTELLTDCMIQCVADQPVWLVDANGDSVLVYPRDYSKWIFEDGKLELKDKK